MARRYYRRSRTIVRAPRKKWASNMKIRYLTTDEPVSILAENSSTNSTPTPIILKVGNFKVQGDVSLNMSTGHPGVLAPSVIVIVFYLPEGVSVSGTTAATVVSQHPEWIMAWKQLDLGVAVPNTSGYLAGGSFSVSSRLKRNLNSGDKVCIACLTDITGTGGTIAVKVNCTSQFWTCAN